MRCRLSLLFVLGLFCTAFPARADWQLTQWNMSRDAVVAASQGSVHAVDGKPGQRRWGLDLAAEGTVSQGLLVKSRFFFDKAGRLKAVSLEPGALADCSALRDRIEKQYGEPADRRFVYKDIDFSEYWRAGSDFVRWNESKGLACFVIIAPLENIDAQGAPHFN